MQKILKHRRKLPPGLGGSFLIENLFDSFLTRTIVRFILSIEQKFEQGGIDDDWLDILFRFGGRGISDGPGLPGHRRHRAPRPESPPYRPPVRWTSMKS